MLVGAYCFQAAKTLRPLTRTITSRASTFYTDPSKDQEPGVSTSPDISLEQREILDNALRVDQAGEIAANWIYRGQITILGSDPRVGPLIQVSHLETALQLLSIDLIW
jgi:3-demethoxyubiquinol 3-hydroxylase